MIVVEFFQERVVGFSRNELVDHVNGGGKEDLDVGIASGIGDAFSQEGLTGAWISDQSASGGHSLFDKLQVQEIEDPGFLLFS